MIRDFAMIGRQDSKGFTILELMVVVALFSVITATAAVSMWHVRRLGPQQAAEYILYDIRHARSEAVKREEIATITFNPANLSYTYTVSNTPINKTVFLGERWDEDVVLLPGGPGGGDPAPFFTFIYSPRGLVAQDAVLNPAGQPGRIYITDRAGLNTNTGKVYRVEGQASGLVDSHVRDFGTPVWADYR